MSAEADTGSTDDPGGKQLEQAALIVTAVTRISAPLEAVWRVVVAFD